MMQLGTKFKRFIILGSIISAISIYPIFLFVKTYKKNKSKVDALRWLEAVSRTYDE